MNQKNLMISPAAADLGLGASLQAKIEDMTEEAKKRLLAAKKNQSLYSPAGLALLTNPMGDGNG
jgi:hypothetical protein